LHSDEARPSEPTVVYESLLSNGKNLRDRNSFFGFVVGYALEQQACIGMMQTKDHSEAISVSERSNEHCPDRDLLERLLTNALLDTELDLLDRHVKGCASCQQTLEELTDDTIWKSGPRRENALLFTDAEPGYPIDPLGVTAGPTNAANEPMARGVPSVPGYEITGELGRGGMGVVQLYGTRAGSGARQRRGTGRGRLRGGSDPLRAADRPAAFSGHDGA
jgi:hypothetical protein